MNTNFELRITEDGNEKDIEEIFELLKEYNLTNREESKNVPIGIFMKMRIKRNLQALRGKPLVIGYAFIIFLLMNILEEKVLEVQF